MLGSCSELRGWDEDRVPPVVVSSDKEQVLPENAQVLGSFSHIHHVVGCLEQQPLPVLNLHKEDQDDPEGECRAAQGTVNTAQRIGGRDEKGMF